LGLEAAVLSWGLSFFFGCRHLDYVSSVLYANLDFLKVQSGLHPEVGLHTGRIEAASSGIMSAMESSAKRAGRYARWQFRLLILGALFYLAWHILEMLQRTQAAA